MFNCFVLLDLKKWVNFIRITDGSLVSDYAFDHLWSVAKILSLKLEKYFLRYNCISQRTVITLHLWCLYWILIFCRVVETFWCCVKSLWFPSRMAIVHVRRVTMVIGARWSVFLDVMGTIVSRLVIVTTTSRVTRRMGGATSGVPRVGWETVVTKVRQQLLVVIVELKSFLLYEFYFVSYFTISIDSSLFCFNFIFYSFVFFFFLLYFWLMWCLFFSLSSWNFWF